MFSNCTRAGFVCAFVAFALNASGAQARVTIDYPSPNSLFPPDFAPPTIEWRDRNAAAKVWTIEFVFADGAQAIRRLSNGEKRPIGEIDQRCADAGAVPPQLTPEEKEGHAWKPDAEAWSALKSHSVRKPAR